MATALAFPRFPVQLPVAGTSVNGYPLDCHEVPVIPLSRHDFAFFFTKRLEIPTAVVLYAIVELNPKTGARPRLSMVDH